MGNPMKEFSHILDLIALESVQVRDNAIEAARIAVTKALTKRLKKEGFFMKLRIYPFNILRENKQAQGAGADRVATGMSHSFGKAIGRSARVRKGKVILSVLVDQAHVEFAKEVLMEAKSKFPCSVMVKIHTDTASIGTKPRKVKMKEAEEKVEEEEKAVEEKKEEEVKKEEKAVKEEKKVEEKKEEKKEKEKTEERKGK